jgi:hypothetical protein
MKRLIWLSLGFALILLAFAVPSIRAAQDPAAPAHRMCAMAAPDGAMKDCCKHEADAKPCCGKDCACCTGGECTCPNGTCACCADGKCNPQACTHEKADCCRKAAPKTGK